MPFYRTSKGFTLVELLVVIAIGAILLGVASANWSGLAERVSASQVNTNIRALFHKARQHAVLERTIVTICPLGPTNQCTQNWNDVVTIFSDQQNLRMLSSPDQVRQVARLAPNGDVRSSSVGSGNRRYFQYKSDGSVHGSIGHLTWCPPSGSADSAIQARINFGGRLRWATDADGDGIVEDSSGTNIVCPG